MPMSLKCMIGKWLHKGQISQEEHDAVIKKLEGHDKQIRAEVIGECVDILNDSFPMVDNMDIVFGFKCAVERLEQLKEQENDNSIT